MIVRALIAFPPLAIVAQNLILEQHEKKKAERDEWWAVC